MTLKWYCWSKWSNVYTPTGGPYQHFIMMLLNWSQQLLITFQYIPLPMVPYMLIKLHAFCYWNLSWFCLFALLQRSALALDQFHNSLMIKEERNGGAAWVNHPRTNANVLVSFVALEPHVPYLWICIPPFKKVSRPSCGGICFSIRFLWSLYYLMIQRNEKFWPMHLTSIEEFFVILHSGVLSSVINWRVCDVPSHSGLLSPRALHQQNVKWFGSHNWTTQQLWTATLILPDAPRCSQIGGVQSDELSGAPRLLHQCSSMFWKLWNRIQEYPEECMVVFEMLHNQTIRMCKFRSYWEKWPRLQDHSGASRNWSRPLHERLFSCLYQIVQFN